MRMLLKILATTVLISMNSLVLAESGEKDWSGMVGATALYKPQYIGDDEIEDSPVGQGDAYTVVGFGGAYSF